jgi:PAS domain S-box-containing protein
MSQAPHPPDTSVLLRTEHAVAGVLARSPRPGDAIAALLPAIGESLGWAAGGLWEPAAEHDGQLVCRALWSAASFDAADWEVACRATALEPGDGLPGRVFADGLPAWIERLPEDLPRAAAAARAGLRSAFCIPLLGARGPLGAVEFFSQEPQPPSPELLATMASVGGQIGQYLERCRAEEELRDSEARMRAMLDAAFDAIVVMDATGTIVGVNRAAERIFGWAAEDAVGHELAELMVPPSLRDAHRRGVERFLRTGEGEVVGHPVELPALRSDGSEFVAEIAIRKLDTAGPPVFTGFIRDLTERNRTEREIRALGEEQAALRRVATLVARSADEARVFDAVTEEVGRLLGSNTANMIRYLGDGTARVIGGWSQAGARNIEPGAVVPLDGDTTAVRIMRTKRPARVDSYAQEEGELAATLRDLGFRSAVGAPIVLDGALWGAVIVSSEEARPFRPGDEHRLHAFAELAAQAIANADAQEQLAASRARIVAVGDAERRRLERNLHDGAQQRLVSMALRMRTAEALLERRPEEARREIASASEELARALEELREIARGLHPAILADHGLEAGVEALAERTPIPVEVRCALDGKPPESVEAAAYYVVAEALTNVAKYAGASGARVSIEHTDGRLSVEVADDGVGGAVATADGSSGLRGLADRVEALGGRLSVTSERGQGTTVRAELPLHDGA